MPRRLSAATTMSSLLLLCGLLYVASGASTEQSAALARVGGPLDQDGGVADFQAMPHSAERAGAARKLLQANKCKRCEYCKCDNNCNCLKTKDGRATEVVRLYHSSAKKCLDIAGNHQVLGQKMQEWDCNGSNAQTFLSIETIALGSWEKQPYMHFIQSTAGLCLDVSENSLTPGQYVNLWKCTGNSNQQFAFVDAKNNGWMTIRPRHGNYNHCLQMNSEGRLQIWPCNNSVYQLFYKGVI